jgi:hypothetical protein
MIAASNCSADGIPEPINGSRGRFWPEIHFLPLLLPLRFIAIMAKKKNKQVNHTHTLLSTQPLSCFNQIIRPWCWYCEREFEDEKGLFTSSLPLYDTDG